MSLVKGRQFDDRTANFHESGLNFSDFQAECKISIPKFLSQGRTWGGGEGIAEPQM